MADNFRSRRVTSTWEARNFPAVGTKVELVSCSDPYTMLKPGTRGEVVFVDDTGTVHVKWENGATLGMVGQAGDRFKVIS